MSKSPRRWASSTLRILGVVAFLATLWSEGAPPAAAAPAGSVFQLDVVGPPGSGQFGSTITALPNGNVVVTDPGYDAGPLADVGAAYLIDGATGQVISALTGSTAGDQVGSRWPVVLSNGNYVLFSPLWDYVISPGNEVADAGAVTWCDGDTGCAGVVSLANSLVGSTANDKAGSNSALALSNGHYVVRSPYWDSGLAADAGAATWCDGTGGCVGAVSAANSLVGSTADDQVGNNVLALHNGAYVVSSFKWDNGLVTDAGAVTWCDGTSGCVGAVSAANSLVGSTAGDLVGAILALSNGDYVVRASYWDDGAVADAGAVTWCDGASGCTGAVSATNSLVGSQTNDRVGSACLLGLSSGNYVVCSPLWDNGLAADAGAATWCPGVGGCTGAVSAANSLVGSQTGDQVSTWLAVALSNGHYVVNSPYWDNGLVADAGALTWGDGTTGVVGAVSAANSLVGSTANDQVGYAVALSNGPYVASSPKWDNGLVVDAGAATWCDGASGCVGAVSAANSLVGSTANDQVGYRITPLTNGNYVVESAIWDDGATANVGAVTWCDGDAGCIGAVSSANSLVGSTASDVVGSSHAAALSNGNYVVCSPNWHRGATVGAGAATWCDGESGCVGAVSAANSLVGSQTNDWVGHQATPLSDGNYVVSGYDWDRGPVVNAGAVTWGNGLAGIAGEVTVANSLVGSTAGDQVGGYGVQALDDGSYVVWGSDWDNGPVVDAGAVTWARRGGQTTGPITGWNSVRGQVAGGGATMDWVYDAFHDQLVVARPAENLVTLFRPSCGLFLPVVLRGAP